MRSCKILAVFLRQVGMCHRAAPFICAAVSDCLCSYDVEKAGYCQRVPAEQGYFITLIDCKCYVLKQYTAFHRLGQLLHIEYLVAHFTQGLKDNTVILAVAGLYFLNGQLFQRLLTGSGLAAL